MTRTMTVVYDNLIYALLIPIILLFVALQLLGAPTTLEHYYDLPAGMLYGLSVGAKMAIAVIIHGFLHIGYVMLFVIRNYSRDNRTLGDVITNCWIPLRFAALSSFIITPAVLFYLYSA